MRIAGNFLGLVGEAYRTAFYKNFAWNLKRGYHRYMNRRGSLEIMIGLGQMREQEKNSRK